MFLRLSAHKSCAVVAMQFAEPLSLQQKELSLYACLLELGCMNAECKNFSFGVCALFSSPKEKNRQILLSLSDRVDHSFSLSVAISDFSVVNYTN